MGDFEAVNVLVALLVDAADSEGVAPGERVALGVETADTVADGEGVLDIVDEALEL